MSNYRFRMDDYHAVKSADIALDGITVLSGENGSGKSTVLRWLNYVAKVLCNYEAMIDEQAMDDYKSLADRMRRVANILEHSRMSINSVLEPLLYDRALRGVELSEMPDRLLAIWDGLVRVMYNGLESIEFDRNRKRLESLFQVDKDDADSLDEFLQLLDGHVHSKISKIEDDAAFKKSHFSQESFKECLVRQLDYETEGSMLKLHIDLLEDGVSLIGEDRFSLPVNLHHHVFMRTERLINVIDDNWFGRSDLSRCLREKNLDGDSNPQHLMRSIRNIIGGSIAVEKMNLGEGMFGGMYFMPENGEKFHLKGAATGIISFSFLLRLLENGWITRDSILIIDEPEAHLHPQWIVEYARIIVMMHKHIGCKIVMASHNPDFVSAIQAIAQKEDVIDNTHFYIAQKVKDEARYVYHDLGGEIDGIFDSFNIALDRIDLYGRTE